jgi:hypothetical protein
MLTASAPPAPAAAPTSTEPGSCGDDPADARGRLQRHQFEQPPDSYRVNNATNVPREQLPPGLQEEALDFDTDAPEVALDCIQMTLMLDPVLLVGPNTTYDRSTCVRGGSEDASQFYVDPAIPGESMRVEVVPNLMVRRAAEAHAESRIDAYLEEHKGSLIHLARLARQLEDMDGALDCVLNGRRKLGKAVRELAQASGGGDGGGLRQPLASDEDLLLLRWFIERHNAGEPLRGSKLLRTAALHDFLPQGQPADIGFLLAEMVGQDVRRALETLDGDDSCRERDAQAVEDILVLLTLRGVNLLDVFGDARLPKSLGWRMVMDFLLRIELSHEKLHQLCTRLILRITDDAGLSMSELDRGACARLLHHPVLYALLPRNEHVLWSVFQLDGVASVADVTVDSIPAEDGSLAGGWAPYDAASMAVSSERLDALNVIRLLEPDFGVSLITMLFDFVGPNAGMEWLRRLWRHGWLQTPHMASVLLQLDVNLGRGRRIFKTSDVLQGLTDPGTAMVALEQLWHAADVQKFRDDIQRASVQ